VHHPHKHAKQLLLPGIHEDISTEAAAVPTGQRLESLTMNVKRLPSISNEQDDPRLKPMKDFSYSVFHFLFQQSMQKQH
jgi:hypothetical protein